MRYLCVLTILMLYPLVLRAQPTPLEYFDSQYADALFFCKENSNKIHKNIICNYPHAKALSIVFPEIVRYSLWQDLLETKALELLYIKYGKQVADFSIGRLQMKPSFAETIETMLIDDTLLQIKYNKLIHYSDTSTKQKRTERIERLKNFEWEFQYLSAFIDISIKKLQKQAIHKALWLNYIAIMYNRGIDTNLSKAEIFINKKTFPYGCDKDNPFTYCEVVEYYYYTETTNNTIY